MTTMKQIQLGSKVPFFVQMTPAFCIRLAWCSPFGILTLIPSIRVHVPTQCAHRAKVPFMSGGRVVFCPVISWRRIGLLVDTKVPF